MIQNIVRSSLHYSLSFFFILNYVTITKTTDVHIIDIVRTIDHNNYITNNINSNSDDIRWYLQNLS